jgi:hypothetical protein
MFYWSGAMEHLTTANEDIMSTTTILHLSYLDDRRAEMSETIRVEAVELARLAAKGREIVYDGGEFSDEEIDDMDDVQFARLAASEERGDDAYSLACAGYLV